MVDIRKAFSAGLPSIGLIVALAGLFQALFWTFPIIGWTIIFSFPINAALFAWAGYRATHTFKLDLKEAGVSGAIVALATGIVMIVIATPIFLLFGTPLDYFFSGAVGFVGMVGLLILYTFLSMIVNFVIAYIGGTLGKNRG
ncbi:MAG TPA: hypothetical protein VJH24_04785 [Candidatus Bilamarchaeaceae archaeon]|nr:hypothetical protein [Candidatus Bilamarchaeaceae archaeon]